MVNRSDQFVVLAIIYAIILIIAIAVAYVLPAIFGYSTITESSDGTVLSTTRNRGVSISEAFSGIIPFTVAFGFLAAAYQTRNKTRTETKSTVYERVAELMKSNRDLATLKMMKYNGPILLEKENEERITENGIGYGYAFLEYDDKFSDKRSTTMYNIDAFEVAVALISHTKKNGLWYKLTNGEFWLTNYQSDIRNRVEELVIILSNLSNQMKLADIKVKDVPSLCTWIEILIPKSRVSYKLIERAVVSSAIWEFVDTERPALRKPLEELVDGYLELVEIVAKSDIKRKARIAKEQIAEVDVKETKIKPITSLDIKIDSAETLDKIVFFNGLTKPIKGHHLWKHSIFFITGEVEKVYNWKKLKTELVEWKEYNWQRVLVWNNNLEVLVDNYMKAKFLFLRKFPFQKSFTRALSSHTVKLENVTRVLQNGSNNNNSKKGKEEKVVITDEFVKENLVALGFSVDDTTVIDIKCLVDCGINTKVITL